MLASAEMSNTRVLHQELVLTLVVGLFEISSRTMCCASVMARKLSVEVKKVKKERKKSRPRPILHISVGLCVVSQGLQELKKQCRKNPSIASKLQIGLKGEVPTVPAVEINVYPFNITTLVLTYPTLIPNPILIPNQICSVYTAQRCFTESYTHKLSYQLWSSLMVFHVINLGGPHTRLIGFPTEGSCFL